jgi:hypothetical protein
MRVANDGHGFTPDVSFCVTSSSQSVQSYPNVGDSRTGEPAMHTFVDPRKRAPQIAPHAVAFVCGEEQFIYAAFEARCLHPAVLEAAVFGIPDPRWGEAVHAVVVPRAEVTAEEFMAFCRGRIAGYKIPKSITFQCEPLPKSGPGKVLKRELRQPFWEGHERQVN